MLQGLPLSILDALQSQPPTHFGYENGENFLDLLKREVPSLRIDTSTTT
jgi:hypothetical protein